MRPCLTPGCNQPAPTGARCPTHHHKGGYQSGWRGAAWTARRRLNTIGAAHCAACNQPHPASHLEVDHIQPLNRGGTDTPANIQVLCRTCHAAKSATERHSLNIERDAIH